MAAARRSDADVTTDSDPRVPWWRTAVIYQIAVPLFADTAGDGTGDLDGVIAHLDHVVDLGATAVWLSPIHPSPLVDFGYDISDYTDVHPRFGDLATVDRLLDEAHRRDLRVLLDWVPNHTSDQHPWFTAAASSTDDPHRDWYVFADAAPDGGPPNNWVSLFGGPSWEWHEPTGQYYLHSFLDCQPDVNWRNADLREEMLDVLHFWLDRGVDGFRIDVAHFVMKDPQLRDNPPAEEDQYHKDLGAWAEQQHLHDQGHEDVHDVFRRVREIVDGYDGDPVTIGEIHEFDLQRWASYFGEGDELHMPFNFVLLDAEWHGAALRAAVRDTQEVLAADAWPCWALGNHDEPRVAERYGAAQARVAMTVLLTLRGTPSIYAGDELGFTDRPVAPERRRDPWGEHIERLSRDPVRIPMAWTDEPLGGFSTADPDEWFLPPAPWAAERSVARQSNDDTSLLALTRALLACRRAHPALRVGDAAVIDEVPDEVFALLRTYDDERIAVVANTADTPVDVALRALSDATVLVTTARDHPEVDDGCLRLRPDEAVVLELTG